MRITTPMLSSNYLRNVSKNMNYLQTLQNQLSTGKKISKPSDDPFAASRIVQMYADVSDNKQYNNNITDVTNFLDVTDTSIQQVSNLYSRVRELLVSAGNAAYGSEQLKSIQDEMKVKVDQLAQLLNTSFDGKFVFGGTKVDSKPVTVVDGKLQYADAVGNGMLVYEDNKGNYTTIKTSSNTKVQLNGTGSIGNLVKDDLQNELNALGPDDTKRRQELESMLDGTKEVYRDPSGKYTTEAEYNNKQVNLREIDRDAIKKELNSAATTDARRKEVEQINNCLIEYDKISADMKIEISQGVTINYNKTAVEILEFKDSDDPSRTINVADLLNDIIDNLGSENKNELLNGNIADLDKAISNLLQKSSEIGAMQNRMESAATQNKSENYNLNSILSNAEDIDFTETMIEFSTLMTIYKASLQISANILPRTIMDYL